MEAECGFVADAAREPGARVDGQVRASPWHGRPPATAAHSSEEGLVRVTWGGPGDQVLVNTSLLWRIETSHFIHSCFRINFAGGMEAT